MRVWNQFFSLGSRNLNSEDRLKEGLYILGFHLITILKSWYPKEEYYQIWMKPIKKYDWFLYELFKRKFADNNVFGQFMMNVTNFKITLQSFICRLYVKLTIGTLITRLKPTKAWPEWVLKCQLGIRTQVVWMSSRRLACQLYMAATNKIKSYSKSSSIVNYF